MSALLDTCDDCTRCHCGARYCDTADGPVCPWCKDDPEVEASPSIRVSTRMASSALNVTTAGGSGSGSIKQPTAYNATASASSSSTDHIVPPSSDESRWAK